MGVYKMKTETKKEIIAKLQKELDRVNKDLVSTNNQRLKAAKERGELKAQMRELIHDLQGVSLIVGLLSQTRDYTDTKAIDASFGVIVRSIDDIVASMEASVSGNSFYVN